MLRRLLSTTLLALPILVSSPASADVGPTQRDCQPDGDGCGVCTKSVPTDPQSQASFDACVASAKKQGLHEACTDTVTGAGGGYSTEVFYCPVGVTVSKGGGCAIAAGAAEGAGLALLLALPLALLRRVARSRRLQRRAQ